MELLLGAKQQRHISTKFYCYKLKRALRIINFSDRRDHAISLFIDANVLPLNFLYYQTMSNLMHDVNKNKVPSGILNLFQKTCSCHSHNTRASASGNFYVNSSDIELYKLSLIALGLRCEMRYPITSDNFPRISSKKHSANYFLIF